MSTILKWTTCYRGNYRRISYHLSPAESEIRDSIGQNWKKIYNDVVAEEIQRKMIDLLGRGIRVLGKSRRRKIVSIMSWERMTGSTT
jgi:hypothetical protein